MRRLVVILPILSLFLFFAILSGSATTVTIGGIFSETEVTTPIMINDVTDLASVTVKVTYDPSVIIVTCIEKGDSGFTSFTPNTYYAHEGWIKIPAYTTEDDGLSGTITFAELTIPPQGSYGGYSDLDITVESFSDSDGKPIDKEIIDGFFYIGMNGDVYADRKIDNDDSLYIAKGIAGIAGYGLKEGASEVSGDGFVDAYDCVYLARHAAGISGYEELW
jgi:hypothetical protein